MCSVFVEVEYDPSVKEKKGGKNKKFTNIFVRNLMKEGIVGSRGRS